MRNKITALVMLALVVLSTMLIASPNVLAQGGVTPDYSVTVTEGTLQLDVRPGQLGADSNTIVVQNTGAHQLTIELRNDCGPLSISPSIATISVGANQDINVPVTVSAIPKTPLRIQDCTVNARVTHVDGVSSLDAYARSAGFKSIVLQYARVAVEADNPFLKLGPGKQTPITFKVHNSGNYIDDYHVEVVNAEKLEDEGFSVTLATPVILGIEPSSYNPLTITVQTPRGTIIGWSDEYYSMEVKATSFVEGARGDSRSATVTFWIRGVFLPGFDPLFTLTALGMVAVVFAQRKNKED